MSAQQDTMSTSNSSSSPNYRLSSPPSKKQRDIIVLESYNSPSSSTSSSSPTSPISSPRGYRSSSYSIGFVLTVSFIAFGLGWSTCSTINISKYTTLIYNYYADDYLLQTVPSNYDTATTATAAGATSIAKTAASSGSNSTDDSISDTYEEWKLWHEMTPSEQNIALGKAFKRAQKYGKMLGGIRDVSKFHTMCPKDGKKPVLFGTGGEHMVCGPPPSNNVTNGSSCKFMSFGIRDDPSFDIHLATEWKCHGFAGDPSITHPSKLHPAVSFHNIGLKMLRSNVEQRRADPEDEWLKSALS